MADERTIYWEIVEHFRATFDKPSCDITRDDLLDLANAIPWLLRFVERGLLQTPDTARPPHPVMYSPEVAELIQAAIEATDDSPRTARLRAALAPFGVC